MPTKSISTMQAGVPLTGATLLQLSTGPVKIFNVEGNVNSTNGNSYYIQLLGTASPVSGTTKPLYSRLAVTSGTSSGINGFAFDYNPQGIDTARMNYPEQAASGGDNTSGVWVAISSTDTVWTSVAATTDVTVDIEQQYNDASNETITGDTSTGVDSLAVYTDPNTAKRLTRIQYSNSVASTVAPVYLQLFASVPATGAIPIQEWTVTSTASVSLFFGQSGFPVEGGTQVVPSGTLPGSYVQHFGCYLYGSSTAGTFTATTGGNWNLKAWNI